MGKYRFHRRKMVFLEWPEWLALICTDIDNNIQRQTSARRGGIMVWMLFIPNGLLTYKLLAKRYQAHDYVSLLTKCAVPIAALNLELSFTFQQDNSAIHRSKLTTDFLAMSSIKTLNWPPRSPDINIAKNIWKILSDIPYNRR